MTIGVGPTAVSSYLQPAIKRNKGNTAVSPVLSETPRKRVHRLKTVVGFLLLIFITNSMWLVNCLTQELTGDLMLCLRKRLPIAEFIC